MVPDPEAAGDYLDLKYKVLETIPEEERALERGDSGDLEHITEDYLNLEHEAYDHELEYLDEDLDEGAEEEGSEAVHKEAASFRYLVEGRRQEEDFHNQIWYHLG